MAAKPLPYLSIHDLLFSEGKHPTLLLQTWADGAYTVTGRGITRHGIFQFSHVTTSDRLIKQTSHRIPELPLFIAVVGGGKRGSCFVRLALELGGVWIGILLQGYSGSEFMLFWPPGTWEHNLEGPGLLRSVTGTDPAAGVEVSETVPTNVRWRLKAIRLYLVTDATVVNRSVSLIIDDGAFVLWQGRATPAMAASGAYSIFFGEEGPDDTSFDSPGSIRQRLPPFSLLQGWRIRTSTSGLQAGDNYGASQLLMEEWIED